jgi:hypothetical protein
LIQKRGGDFAFRARKLWRRLIHDRKIAVSPPQVRPLKPDFALFIHGTYL